MEIESWKEPLLKLPLSELKKVQSFIAELVKTEELVQESKEEQIVIFPKFNVGEQRKDARINLSASIEGTCSIVKGNEADPIQEEVPIQIMDISKHGLRFITTKHIQPSSILMIKFYLASAKSSDEQFYKNPHKKIFAEVRRVIETKTPKGIKYDIGALSIDNERVAEFRDNQKGYSILNKQLSIKGDMRIMIVYLKESRSKSIEESLLKQNYVVVKANQKQQAMAMMRKSRCNIVVSDIHTAMLNDFELVKDFKEEFPDVGLLIEINTIDDWMKIDPLGVDDYLTKDFSEREFNVILEHLHKKLISKSIFGGYFKKRKQLYQSVLVISKNEDLRKFFCKLSAEKNIKMFFVNYTEHAATVLKTYKIDLIFIDTEATHLDGCQFILNTRRLYPNIITVVTSNNPQERVEFIGSGADFFITEPTKIHKILIPSN